MVKSKGKKAGKGMAFRGGLSGLMKQAHRIQSKMESVKEEIKDEKWTTEAAGGKIKVTINGEKEISQIEIATELIDPEDPQTLQDVIISAVNAAITLADNKLEEATEKATGGLKLPGMF